MIKSNEQHDSQTNLRLCTYGNNLFLISSKENYYIITEYNSKFEVISKIGQGNPELPFYFDFSQSLIVSDKFFIYFTYDEDDQQTMNLINKSSRN